MCDVGKNQVVLIMANGKTHALAVGKTLMSTEEMYVSHYPNNRFLAQILMQEKGLRFLTILEINCGT